MSRLPVRVEHPLSMSLGAAVLAARLRAALTPSEVARRVGVPLDMYGRIERGETFPSVLTLRRLCLALEIPSDELLGLEAPESLDMNRLVSAARGLKASQLRLLHRLAESLRPAQRG
jgi:transcriptional regulator with XRE-family HTH domain